MTKRKVNMSANKCAKTSTASRTMKKQDSEDFAAVTISIEKDFGHSKRDLLKSTDYQLSSSKGMRSSDPRHKHTISLPMF